MCNKSTCSCTDTVKQSGNRISFEVSDYLERIHCLSTVIQKPWIVHKLHFLILVVFKLQSR